MLSESTHQADHLIGMAATEQPVAEAPLARAQDSVNELHLLEQLRRGDESSFVSLTNRYASTMLRLARTYVNTWTVAEDVVQDAWIATLEGINRFDGKVSVKTWIFRIVTNRAKTYAQREARSIPFSSLPDGDPDCAEWDSDPDRFLPSDRRGEGSWIAFPGNWEELPEDALLSQEIRLYLEQAIEVLPPHQRQLIILRDIEGWTAEEACRLLRISEANQRVLLHRARSRVRKALEGYLQEK